MDVLSTAFERHAKCCCELFCCLEPIDNGFGELVWLTIPKNVSYNSIEDSTHWQETVLIAGPDVMFEVVDLDDSDQSVEIVAAHFFGMLSLTYIFMYAYMCVIYKFVLKLHCASSYL